MKRLSLLSVTTLISFSLFGCSSNNEQVFGQVITSVGSSVEGLQINLQQKGTGKVLATTTTGKFGFFLFSELNKADISKDVGGDSNTQNQLCTASGQCSDFLPLDTGICKNVGSTFVQLRHRCR